ncbi:SsrA-binding protein [Mycobacteroides abscessus subsp. massiliense]|nr:SsrA-binding protein [Mycobacteroides abscessus subsp. massiliense]
MSKKPTDGRQIIASNRKARHNYSILPFARARPLW